MAACLDDDNVKLHSVWDNNGSKSRCHAAIWLLRKQTRTRLTQGSSPLWRHIIASSYIRLAQLHDAVTTEHSKVISYNTDCILLTGAAAVELNPQKPGDIRRETEDLELKVKGTLVKELAAAPKADTLPKMWQWSKIEEVEQWTRSCLVTGISGSGKTQKLKEMYDGDVAEELKVCVVSYTNPAADELRSRGVKVARTLDSLFLDSNTQHENVDIGCNFDIIMVDEYTQVGKKWMALFHAMKLRKPSLVFPFFGDHNQTHAVETDGMWYRYHECHTFAWLCDYKRMTLSYKPRLARYTPELRHELEHLLRTGRLSEKWEAGKLWTPAECDFEITRLRRGIVDEVNEKHVVEKQPDDNVIIDDPASAKYWKGMPLLLFDNLLKLKLYNSQRVIFERKEGANVTVTKDKKEYAIPRRDFITKLRVGYCDTIFRVQGRTIRTRYNIRQANDMTLNQLYTALSRATRMEDIGICVDTTEQFVADVPPSKGQQVELRRYVKDDKEDEKFSQVLRLKRGIIYEACDDEGFMYRGCSGGGALMTADDILQKRVHGEQGHYANPTSAKMAEWLSSAQIKWRVLETFLYISRGTLLDIEAGWIARIPPEKAMNSKGVMKTAAKAVEVEKKALEVDCSRYQITTEDTYYPNTRRYVRRHCIYYRENGQRVFREFAWGGVRGAAKRTKEEAMEAALACRAELIRRNFA